MKLYFYHIAEKNYGNSTTENNIAFMMFNLFPHLFPSLKGCLFLFLFISVSNFLCQKYTSVSFVLLCNLSKFPYLFSLWIHCLKTKLMASNLCSLTAQSDILGINSNIYWLAKHISSAILSSTFCSGNHSNTMYSVFKIPGWGFLTHPLDVILMTNDKNKV